MVCENEGRCVEVGEFWSGNEGIVCGNGVMGFESDEIWFEILGLST